MLTRRSAAGAAVIHNSIYVTGKHSNIFLLPSLILLVGGHDGSSIFSTAEQYNIQTSTWRMIPSMHSKRCRHGVAAASGLLFRFEVCGMLTCYLF